MGPDVGCEVRGEARRFVDGLMIDFGLFDFGPELLDEGEAEVIPTPLFIALGDAEIFSGCTLELCLDDEERL